VLGRRFPASSGVNIQMSGLTSTEPITSPSSPFQRPSIAPPLPLCIVCVCWWQEGMSPIASQATIVAAFSTWSSTKEMLDSIKGSMQPPEGVYGASIGSPISGLTKALPGQLQVTPVRGAPDTWCGTQAPSVANVHTLLVWPSILVYSSPHVLVAMPGKANGEARCDALQPGSAVKVTFRKTTST
jgi:hypothetical protein